LPGGDDFGYGLSVSFDLPRNIILPVDQVDVRLDPGPHPFERDNAEAIAENWRRESAGNPALFDGTVVLLSMLAYRGTSLVGRCHAVRYSTFMLWRRNGQVAGAEHAYAHAMLVAGDNALVAIRMGSHTVNAGRVYFAAGSFEPTDFRDGLVDVDFNMIREVREETGLDLSGSARGRRYYALSTVSGTVIFRRYRETASAGEIARRISAFVAAEAEPEIDGPVIIRDAADLPDGLMEHMKPLIEWHFAGKD
jgi:8-oxo-dGTP pyrophosphatase MutT (NUDIX family)